MVVVTVFSDVRTVQEGAIVMVVVVKVGVCTPLCCAGEHS